MAAHNLLNGNANEHPDTAAASPPGQGSLVKGNDSSVWNEFTKGSDGTFLKSGASDLSWASIVQANVGGLTTSDSPTFAGLTLNGGLTAGGNLVPDATGGNRDLGSSASQWRDLHLARNILFDLTQVVTLAVTVPGAARTYTIPDFGGSDDFVGKAATQALTGKTYNGLSLAGTGSLDVAAGKTVDINESLTVNTNPVILDQSLRTIDSPTFAGFGGDINMNSHKIQNLPAPASDNDAARKVDIDTVPWTDYSASANPLGWSGTPTVSVKYKKVGKLVFVHYKITGTSNATTATFDLPYSNGGGATLYASLATLADNGTYEAAGYTSMISASNRVNCYRSAGTAWTDSGTKAIYGSFWYEAST